MTKGDIERYRVEAAIAAMAAVIGNERLYIAAVAVAEEEGMETCQTVAEMASNHAYALMAELGLGGE